MEIKEYWSRFKNGSNATIQKIEESPKVERALLRYEMLEPKKQKMIRYGVYALCILLISYVVFSPIFSLWKKKRELHQYRDLISHIRNFNQNSNVQIKAAPRPKGWKDLAANSEEEVEESLFQYVSGHLGVPLGSLNIENLGNKTFSIELIECTIRQATHLIFQIDGWNPRLVASNIEMRVHPEEKDLINLKLTSTWNANAKISN